MKKAMPYLVLVGVGYVLLIAAVLYLVPMPWNLVIALVVLLMAARFLFTVVKAGEIGRRTPHT